MGMTPEDIVIEVTNPKEWLLIKGKGLLDTLEQYCYCGFIPEFAKPINSSINGRSFSSMPLVVQRQFLNKKCTAILFASHNSASARFSTINELLDESDAPNLWNLVQLLNPEAFSRLELTTKHIVKAYKLRSISERKLYDFVFMHAFLSIVNRETLKNTPLFFSHITVNTLISGFALEEHYYSKFVCLKDEDKDFYTKDNLEQVLKVKSRAKRIMLYIYMYDNPKASIKKAISQIEKGWETLPKEYKNPNAYTWLKVYYKIFSK